MKRAAFLLVFAFAAQSGRASADDASNTRAQALFDEGVQFLGRGEYAEACARLAESQRIAPAGGTALDLGYCHEKLGQLVAALLAYEDAHRRAESAGRADRSSIAATKVDELKRRVCRVRIRLDRRVSTLEDLRVEIDGAALADPQAAAPVDAGEHTITVRAKGMMPLSRATEVRGEGATVELVVDALVEAPPASPRVAVAPLATHPAPAPSTARKTWALGVGATGVVFIGAGAVAGIVAIDDQAESDRLCHTRTTCSPDGVAAEDRARTSSWVANGGIGLGLALVGVATYLWLTAHPSVGVSETAPLLWRF